MQPLRAGLAASSLLILVACTTETITTSPAPPAETDTEPPEDDDAVDAGRTDASKPKEAGVDAAPPKEAEWTAGESGKSCADACKAQGKTCAVACTDHRSCGSHDGEPPPYAGYACYYRETKSNSGSFRTNNGRSLTTCDEVATSTWSVYGSEYTLGAYAGGNPVSCCCE